jgi:Uncharacterized protein conserved in bacteria
MSQKDSELKKGFLALGVCLAMGALLASLVIARALERVKLSNQIVTVKGYAEQEITSDMAVWQCSFGVEAASLRDAYARLEKARGKVLKF